MLAAAPAHAATEIIHDWPTGIPSGPELEAAGAVIGEIRVNVGDIFDPSVPSENIWLYRTANKLHINTRESVVRNQLLFKPGQPYVQRLVDETERILLASNQIVNSRNAQSVLNTNGGTVAAGGTFTLILSASDNVAVAGSGTNQMRRLTLDMAYTTGAVTTEFFYVVRALSDIS